MRKSFNVLSRHCSLVAQWRKCSVAEAFLINFAVAFFALIGLILRGKGLFTLCNDFNEQQIPFHILTNEAIKKGEIFWNWNIDLGSSFIGSMGYYTLGSPFSWISFLFPAMAFPYLAGWLFMLKYAVAGVSSFLYLKDFVKDKKIAIAGSMLYAFSGFQSTNLLFYSFHDAVAFFPLMLWGLERLLKGGRKGVFAFTVFLNAFVNYYFFVQEVIFLLLYYLCREGVNLWKKRRIIFQCLAEGVMGILMAAVLLYPSILFTLANPRVANRLPMENWIDTGRRYFLKLFRVFLFPGEMMADQSCISEYDWSSWSAYLPMVGLGLVICYFFRRRWDWIRSLLAVCAVFACIPLLNSAFMMFSDTNYHRWYYMMILIMCLASVRVLEERKEYPVKLVYLFLFLGMFLSMFVFFWWSENRFELVFRKSDFVVISMIGITGMLISLFFVGFVQKEVWFGRLLLGGIGVWACISTAFTGSLYQGYAGQPPESYYNRLLAFKEMEEIPEGCRFQTDDNTLTMTVPVMGTGSFHSTVNGSIFEFYEALGEPRGVFSPKGNEDMQTLLSAGYFISDSAQEEGRIRQRIEGKEKTYYMYEKENTLPIGFTYDTCLTESEFLKTDASLRPLVMLDSLVIPDEMEGEMEGRLQKATKLDDLNPADCTADRREEASIEFERNSTSFHSVIVADAPKYAFFSVPFDKGWKARVNGESVKILKSNGMMAVPVEKGSNEISFSYRNTDLMTGGLLSLIGFGLWGVYVYLGRRKIS